MYVRKGEANDMIVSNVGHMYVQGDIYQVKGSAERTPTKMVVVGCADEQTLSKGLPSRQANSGGGVQQSAIFHRGDQIKPARRLRQQRR